MTKPLTRAASLTRTTSVLVMNCPSFIMEYETADNPNNECDCGGCRDDEEEEDLSESSDDADWGLDD